MSLTNGGGLLQLDNHVNGNYGQPENHNQNLIDIDPDHDNTNANVNGDNYSQNEVYYETQEVDFGMQYAIIQKLCLIFFLFTYPLMNSRTFT